MMIKTLPSRDRILERLEYFPDSGDFYWKPIPNPDRYETTWNKRFAGQPAGYLRKKGYRTICIDGVAYLAHRLAYKVVHDIDPGDMLVDHKIQAPVLDNSAHNIRIASHGQNRSNSAGHTHRNGIPLKRPVKGVRQIPSGRYQVRVSKDGKTFTFGVFATLAEAQNTYNHAASHIHGEFAHPSW